MNAWNARRTHTYAALSALKQHILLDIRWLERYRLLLKDSAEYRLQVS